MTCHFVMKPKCVGQVDGFAELLQLVGEVCDLIDVARRGEGFFELRFLGRFVFDLVDARPDSRSIDSRRSSVLGSFMKPGINRSDAVGSKRIEQVVRQATSPRGVLHVERERFQGRCR